MSNLNPSSTSGTQSFGANPPLKGITPAPGAHLPSDAIDSSAPSALSDMVGKASDIASGAATSVSKMASGISDTLRDGVETQKNAGADAVSGLARSARNAANDIESTSPQVARLVRSSADAVESVSKNVRDQSVGELMDSVVDFAGRQPLAFFGCGILAGVIFARLLTKPGR